MGTGAESPLVSGLMTCLNSERHIAEAIDSALGQTYGEVELVVRDNASSDSTPEILREYERRHPEQVRVEYGDEDVGPAASRAESFERARGELICWLDSDDVWKPQMVAKEVEVMSTQPEVGIVHGWFEAIDEQGGVIPSGGQQTAPAGDLLVPLWEQGCFIGAATVMFRRKALDERGVGLYHRDWVYGDDYYSWLVISLRWRTAGIDEVLASYRMHGEQLSSAQGNHFVKRIALLEEFLDDFPEAKEKLGAARRTGLAGHWRQAAEFEAEHGSGARAAWYRLRALSLEPGRLVRPLRAAGHRAFMALVRAKKRLTRETTAP